MTELDHDLPKDDGQQVQVYGSKKLQRLQMMLRTAQTLFGDNMVSKVSVSLSSLKFCALQTIESELNKQGDIFIGQLTDGDVEIEDPFSEDQQKLVTHEVILGKTQEKKL